MLVDCFKYRLIYKGEVDDSNVVIISMTHIDKQIVQKVKMKKEQQKSDKQGEKRKEKKKV